MPNYDKKLCDEIYLIAEDEYNKGNKKKAFLLYFKGAQLGDPESQNRVGVCYDVGEGVKKDSDLALHWYKKAWRNDASTGTCHNIASLYAVSGNRERAIYWWSKAVDAEDGDAMVELARYYLTKKWVPPTKLNDAELEPAPGTKNEVVIKAEALLKRAVNASYICQASIEEAQTLLERIAEIVE